MIRINLLGLKKELPKGGGGPAISMEGAKLTALLVLILALAVGALAAHWWMLNTANVRLTAELQKQREEKTRLANVKTEYEQFEKRQQFLIKRINIIDDLRKKQSGPVILLNTVANTVIASEQLWLTSFDNDGLKVNMDGVAGNVNTVADFISNLKRSGQFKSVEIKQTFHDDKYKDMPVFVFSISAELTPPPPAATPTPPPVGAKT